MNWHKQEKLKKAMRRTCALLLVVFMLPGSVLATDNREVSLSVLKSKDGEVIKENDNTVKTTKELQGLYGDDWEAVYAMQPGDTYIGEEYVYVCNEETRVKWKRVKAKSDLNGADWLEDKLLLLTSADGAELYLGNDYADRLRDGSYTTIGWLKPSTPNDVRLEPDTNSGGKVEVYCYPELQEYVANSTGGFPYPDNFETVGTMNAPYIRYVGTDSDNDKHHVFKIILSQDNGEISSVALGLNGDDLATKSINSGSNFTFRMTSFLDIFVNVPDEEDVRVLNMFGGLFGAYGSIKGETYIAYVGEKYTGKRIDVFSLDPDAAQDPEALENVYGGAIEFYRWQRIDNTIYDSDIYAGYASNLQNNMQQESRLLLVWDDQYFLSGDDFRQKDDGDGMAFYANEGKTSSAAPGNVAQYPAIDTGTYEVYGNFYTVDGMGTPYIYHQGKDSQKDNDYCEYFTVQLAGADDRPSGKWLCDADNKFGICMEEEGQDFKTRGSKDITEELCVGFVFGREHDSDNDAEEGYCKLFIQDSGSKYDTGFFWNGNVLYGDHDWWKWDYGQFKMYIGTKVTYPAIRQDYIVGEDQFMHISENGAMLKETTIVVRTGGVLSIESWFMNNGRIIVDGGTLIVQNASNPLGDEVGNDTEDSVIMPYLDLHPTISGSLELRNGGELIIMDDARAAFSSITATGGSSIFNNGILLAETITLKDATLENREGRELFAGYDFRTMDVFRTGSVTRIGNNATSRMATGVSCIYMDLNSGVQNDGNINYASAVRWVTGDSVKRTGEGSYTFLQGKAVK